MSRPHPIRVFAALLFAIVGVAAGLSGCAGVPIGHSTFAFAGIGVIHMQKEGDATAIRSRSIGLSLGCGQATLGIQSLFCAALPAAGDVAIIDETHTKTRLKIISTRKYEDEVVSHSDHPRDR